MAKQSVSRNLTSLKGIFLLIISKDRLGFLHTCSRQTVQPRCFSHPPPLGPQLSFMHTILADFLVRVSIFYQSVASPLCSTCYTLNRSQSIIPKITRPSPWQSPSLISNHEQRLITSLRVWTAPVGRDAPSHIDSPGLEHHLDADLDRTHSLAIQTEIVAAECSVNNSCHNLSRECRLRDACMHL